MNSYLQPEVFPNERDFDMGARGRSRDAHRTGRRLSRSPVGTRRPVWEDSYMPCDDEVLALLAKSLSNDVSSRTGTDAVAFSDPQRTRSLTPTSDLESHAYTPYINVERVDSSDSEPEPVDDHGPNSPIQAITTASPVDTRNWGDHSRSRSPNYDSEIGDTNSLCTAVDYSDGGDHEHFIPASESTTTLGDDYYVVSPPTSVGIAGRVLWAGTMTAMGPIGINGNLPKAGFTRGAALLAEGKYQFVNLDSGLTMDLAGTDKAPIVGKLNYGGSSQCWEILRQDQGYYIRSIVTGRYVVPSQKTKYRRNLVTSDCPVLWIFEYVDQDTYRIRLAASGSNSYLAIKRTHRLRDRFRDTLAEWVHEEYVQLLDQSSQPRQDWKLILRQ